MGWLVSVFESSGCAPSSIFVESVSLGFKRPAVRLTDYPEGGSLLSVKSLPVAFLTPARGLRKNAMHSRRFPGTP
jgi:hypothetical protein